MFSKISLRGIDWKKFLSLLSKSLSPVKISIGILSLKAAAVAMTRFKAPGDAVAMQTPILSEVLVNASAA